VRIERDNVSQVLAALGMVLKLAAEHLEQTKAESAGILIDGADAVASIAAAMKEADGAAQIELGGQGRIWTRGILVTGILLLQSRRWTCPCLGRHGSGSPCWLVTDLSDNLVMLGGELSPDEL
jgi:hypothetical protein